MALALYRKYRPQSLSELTGQDWIRDTLLASFASRRWSHAYLFSGPRGTGKTSTARLLAQALQCLNLGTDGLACGTCEACVQNQEGRLLDLIEIDAASNRGIDEIRELKSMLKFAPSVARAKVYIVDEVHMLTKEAFNALLKSLEEPPAHVHFILATTELHKVPATIISRCQRYEFKRIPDEAMAERLRMICEAEGIVAEAGALLTIAQVSDGGMRDAISLLDQWRNSEITEKLIRESLGLKDEPQALELLLKIVNGDLKGALDDLERLHRDGTDLLYLTQTLLRLARAKFHEACERRDPKSIDHMIRVATELDWAWRQLKNSPIPTLPLELAFARSVTFSPLNAQEVASTRSHVSLSEALQKSVQNPSVKTALSTARFEEKTDRVLLHLGSHFHWELLSRPAHFVELEAKVKELLGGAYRLDLVLEDAGEEEDPLAVLGWNQ